LPSFAGMPKLRLVKTNNPKQEVPRRGRGASVSSERRFRYPSEEIWQVSDDRWQVAESRYLLPLDDFNLARSPAENRGDGGSTR